MDKKSIPFIVILFAVMLAWPVLDRKVIKPLFPPSAPPIEQEQQPTDQPDGLATSTDVAAAPELKAATVTKAAPVIPTEAETTPTEPEQIWQLKNDQIIATVSSYGASISDVIISSYPELNEPGSPPVDMDFGKLPALQYHRLEGFAGNASFELEDQTGNTIILRRSLPNGVSLIRTLTLTNQYEIHVDDHFVNNSDASFAAKDSSLQVGPMNRLPGKAVRGLYTLGIDSMLPGMSQPDHFTKKLDTFFKEEKNNNGYFPMAIQRAFTQPVDWVAAKNKYFVQILRPENGGAGFGVYAIRSQGPKELADPEFVQTKMQSVEDVYATITLPEMVIESGDEMVRSFTYYVGPKKYTLLRDLGFNQEGVMEFATSMPVFKSLNVVMVPIKSGILWLLNFTHDYVWPHNYGVSIILITLLIRLIFWPITHKSSQSMKKMQEIQPLIKELRAKYKDEPQKLQQATMQLYKEHKVNPVSGCLPMVIQIPVFFALFAVLRNAIELRFAHFLWVADLSEPENLFANVLPIPLNILPLIMVGTQFIQQKMMPTSADPSQAKMMRYMPLMFLFILYSMPSGLVIYWTTNTVLMIIQQVMIKRKTA